MIARDLSAAGSRLPATALGRIGDVARLIGNTPMLAITVRWRGAIRSVYAKAEFLNFTGSIKDRMALHIIADAYRQGDLRPGDLIAEATSGNTGISFAAIGRALGHPVTIYMPDWMSQERRLLIRSFGAAIHDVSADAGGFLGSIRLCEQLRAGRDNVFLPGQFENAANVDAHWRSTGPEIVAQLESIGLAPDAFVAGVGTGGTVMGVGAYLRSRSPRIQVHPLEPAESPTLSTGVKAGRHRIQGISDEFIPAIVDLAALSPVLKVSDGDAILMAQRLASELGLGVGISSGANLLGALMAQERLSPTAVVATVFCDDNKKYLSTDLTRDEPVRPGCLSAEIELVSLSVVPATKLDNTL